MAVRMVGVDSATPKLPAAVITASQGTDAGSLAKGDHTHTAASIGALDEATADGLYVNVDGDSMTGPLTLAADPSSDLQAATKRYVDAHAGGLTQAEADARYVNLDGDTMTDPLVIKSTTNGAALRLSSVVDELPQIEWWSVDGTNRFGILRGAAAGVMVGLHNTDPSSFSIFRGYTPLFTVDQDGNVSMGSTTMDAGLGSGAFTLQGLFDAIVKLRASKFPSGPNTDRATITATGDSILLIDTVNSETGDIVFRPKGTERLRLKGSGAVEVTADPTTALGVATKQYVDRLKPKTFSATGVAGTTTGTDNLVACTLTIPAQPVAGTIMVQGMIRLDKTVAGDAFYTDLTHVGVNQLVQLWPTQTGVGSVVAAFNGRTSLPANTAATLTVTVARQAGTGTATTQASYNTNHIDALWVPD